MTRVPPSSPLPGGSGPARPGTQTPNGFIGRYQVLEKIGEGGMGSLYLARDPAIDRLVAIKLLRRGFDTEAVRERFAREARAAGRLRHPNIVTIFDVGEHDGDPFIAMEFLAGETLGELIRHGAGLSVSRRLRLLEELCDGLAYAHRAGLVHRDIKPANLMVDAEGVLKILDFGIVRVGESGITGAGVLVGTINYMAPEQVLGSGVDHRSDIFAVGLVAYELLSGRQAFPGTIKDGLLKRIPEADVEPLAQVAPGLDPDVIAMVEQALEKDPGDRYQELARMRNDLARARQRIEVEEEQAAIRAASASAETAFIAQEATTPGIPAPATPSSTGRHLADAERALADGQYRVALTIAGRAAALDPKDRTPSIIVARAEAGLLERGRTVESEQLVQPSTAGRASSPAFAPAPSGTGTAPSQRANYLAIGVAVLALGIAGFAIWTRGDRTTAEQGNVRDGSPNNATGRPDLRPGTDTGGAPTGAASPPPTSAAPPPVADPQPTADSGSAGTRESVRDTKAAASDPRERTRGEGRRGAEPTAAAARDSRSGKTAGAGRQPPNPPASRTGAPVAPPTPEPKPEAPTLPTTPPDHPLSTLPGSQAPRPRASSLPKPPEPPAAETKAPEPKPAEPKPARDLRAEAAAQIQQVLARYEAAWEALNFDALAAVHALSSAEARTIRRNMSGTRSYEIEMTGCGIEPGQDLRHASATCNVTRRFRGEVSGEQVISGRTTFQLEKRDERWMIVSISSAR